MTTLLEELNDKQREAVQYCDGPELVIAGAGSGKTRVLTYKIAYLLQSENLHLAPWNILALTFTNKAAREMKERVARLVGHELASGVNMGTFHSVFARILRREAMAIGYTSDYTIYDESDSRSLLGSIVKELGYDSNKYKPASVHYHISMAKNRLVTAEMYANDTTARNADSQSAMPLIYIIYSMYEQRCRAANVMDFDDLLLNTYLLFKNNPNIREKYANKFKYVLVDEFQDTNKAQMQIIEQLTNRNGLICAVGDDAQSIYSFRGADISNILDFHTYYDDIKVFLDINYRSTKKIVNAANSLIKHNVEQIADKENVYSDNSEGEPLVFHKCYSDKIEAQYVAQEISRIRRNDGSDYGDFAILYRTNAQSRCFEDEFRRQGIPYRIYGGLSFYQRKEIKDILAYLRVAVNPNDEEAMKRIINTPKRAIGAATLSKISAQANAHGVTFWQVLLNSDIYNLDVNKGTRAKLDKFAMLISSFGEQSTKIDAATLTENIMQQSGLSTEIFGDRSPEGIARQENIGELMNQLHDFVAMKYEEGLEEEVYIGNFVQEAALLTDRDNDDESDSKVTLMTIHAAKGLEFPTVFVVGLEDKIFPGQRAMENQHLLEEERRLLYVAITRAERHCYLTCAKTRFRYGRVDYDIPSRFIKDIDSRYLHIDGEEINEINVSFSERLSSPMKTFSSTPQPLKPRASAAPADDATPRRSMLRMASAPVARVESCTSYTDGSRTIHVGSVINHQRFGKGEIVKIEGKGENAKATVKFDLAGQKQLLLKFARYEVLKM